MELTHVQIDELVREGVTISRTKMISFSLFIVAPHIQRFSLSLLYLHDWLLTIKFNSFLLIPSVPNNFETSLCIRIIELFIVCLRKQYIIQKLHRSI